MTRAEIHHRHRDVTGGWLRPAVFGVMDGLVSNASLIAGVVGGGAGAKTVTVAGLAGLAAGAFSMATGEYTSVRSQSEMTLAEIAVERLEIARNPQAEEDELAALYESRGLTPELAREVARQLHSRDDVAWRVHAREELGVDPDDLPSPWLAAGSSFVAFSIGALVPVLPFLFGFTSVVAAIVLTALGLAGTGAVVGRLTSRSPLASGARQLLLGAAAAAVTFGIGHLVGATLT
ncbi:membrane protein [Sphaerisporangium krabiense]|uniref:VIT1/CCC1 family predicted Fe2+/Mn2+ transporter n=1 Tax=Sphaerisporangium krabiense TaxID=763782 RepID=A0A7W8ZC45_9ACTN|nr:VIT1/CCC1 transporter family protein [Sphaerisporangium krabiense]MBB5631262.1 VIT1/CCC1 family predicted Fe2+/Mn2+ transporter [Sphaerisporangium krabiense]GII61125.1 membrane protein [Sphaerisporangium krabiense]